MSEQFLEESENQTNKPNQAQESDGGLGKDLVNEAIRSTQLEQGKSDSGGSPASLPPVSKQQDSSSDDVQTQDNNSSMSATLGLNPMIADDADLIEKEWVQKAKSIVEETKDDPREQNKQLTKVKADYLKKRYNRDLKINDE